MDAWDFSCSWMSAPSLLFHPITLSNPILMRDLFWGWGCSFSCVFINELHAHHSLWGKLLYITDWLKTFVIFFCCLAFPLFLAVSTSFLELPKPCETLVLMYEKPRQNSLKPCRKHGSFYPLAFSADWGAVREKKIISRKNVLFNTSAF